MLTERFILVGDYTPTKIKEPLPFESSSLLFSIILL